MVWLHTLLFVLTFLTTTAFGSVLAESFGEGVSFNMERLFDGYVFLTHLDSRIWTGLSFSAPLLLILVAHEFGHYFTCKNWKVDASLPYFLPSPLLLGTFGAFIRIRSPIYTRKGLFDIGASGPLAGIALVIPCLVYGVWMSHVRHGSGATAESVTFGTPLLMRAVEWIRFGNTNASEIVLHPVAMAAWTGLLATAMNLLPIGQLDGGHIVYAALGERWHRTIASAVIVLLVALGFLYRAWWIWAVVMFLFGRRHPLIYDQTPLRGTRVGLAAGALILLALCVAVVPVSTR